MNKRLFCIILVVFIDLLGFSLILPLLPYYAESFHAKGSVKLEVNGQQVSPDEETAGVGRSG